MSYRILLVDGDIASRYRLRLALRARGYEVETRASAEPVVRRLTNLAAGAPPNLLMLGNQLPGMGSIEVLERLRATPAIRALPVVLCVASEDPAIATIARRYAGVAVLRKDRLETSLDAALAEAREHSTANPEVPIVAKEDTLGRGPASDDRQQALPPATDLEFEPSAAQHLGTAEVEVSSAASIETAVSMPLVVPASRTWLQRYPRWSRPRSLWLLLAACCVVLTVFGLGLLL